jgi:hypothetical protein
VVPQHGIYNVPMLNQYEDSVIDHDASVYTNSTVAGVFLTNQGEQIDGKSISPIPMRRGAIGI